MAFLYIKSMKTDFEKYALSQGIGSARLDQFSKNMPTFGYISPMITEERQLNVAQMDVFSRLMTDRIIFMGDVVCAETSNIITSQLMYLNSVSDDDIKMFINSPGGHIIDGLAIVDVMNYVNADVATYAIGMAASMGSILLTCGEKGKRYALPNSEILLHQPLGGTQGQCSDIQIQAKHIQYYKDKIYNILQERTGQSLETITEACDRDNWLTAQQALDFGLIDEVITKSRS